MPEQLFAALLPSGRRVDADSRPEFSAGSVDLLVSPLFRHIERKTPLPLAHVYLIDVSYNAQKSGVRSREKRNNAFFLLISFSR